MTKQNIISAALAVASLTGVALAGTPAPVVVYKAAPAPCEKRFCGALSAGYSTNYDYRGLVPTTSDGTNYDPIALDLGYKMSDHWKAYAGLDYKAIWDKEIVNNNEFGVEVGAKYKGWDRLTISPNYKFTHGGFMGEYVKRGYGKSHSIFQSFGVGAKYDLGAGFFVGASADYVFAGTTGWWYQGVVGYEAKLTERLCTIISAEYNATSSFYGPSWGMGDGDMSYGLKLQLPYKLCKHVYLTPFIGTWWLGSSANNINQNTRRVLSDDVLRNFTVYAGACLTWRF